MYREVVQEASVGVVPMEVEADAPADARSRCCVRYFGPPGSELSALWLVFVLTTGFTLAQLVGAVVANSLSMMGDSASMLLDCATYLLNIYTEIQKERYENGELDLGMGLVDLHRLERRVAVVSALTLIGVTIFVVYDAITRLVDDVEVKAVQPAIMLGFTIVNLVIDIVGFMSIFNVKCCVSETVAECIEARQKPAHRPSASSSERTFVQIPEGSRKKSLNITSALVHLMADALRTVTVLVTSLYVMLSDAEPIQADALSSLVVCTLIFFAAAFLLCEAWSAEPDPGNVVDLDEDLDSILP